MSAAKRAIGVRARGQRTGRHDCRPRYEKPVCMDVGKRVRTLRCLDLGDGGKVEKGAVGVLESTNNGPYMPYLVKFPNGTFAFEDGEIEEVDDKPA